MRAVHQIRPRGNSPLSKPSLLFVIMFATVTVVYQLRREWRVLSLDESLSEFPNTKASANHLDRHDASDLANIPSWRGLVVKPPPFVPTQTQKLAVLLPCWSDCAQASILIIYLSGLLRQQGIPFRIHVFEQVGGAAFNPGLLVNIGFQVALQTGSSFVPDYVAYQQASLTAHVNVSFAYPSVPFLHLGTEQSVFNYMLPYDAYCGGAWLIKADLYRVLGGMSNAYVGYEGLEDDFCRRLMAKLGSGGIVRANAGRGRFSASEDAVLQELAAAQRQRNRQMFDSRWGPNTTAAAAEMVSKQEGMESIPQNWPQLLTVVQQSETHGWWTVRLPNS